MKPEYTSNMARLSIDFDGNDALEKAARRGALAGYLWLVSDPNRVHIIEFMRIRGMMKQLDYEIIGAGGLGGSSFVDVCRGHALSAWELGWDVYAQRMRDKYAYQFPMEALAASLEVQP